MPPVEPIMSPADKLRAGLLLNDIELAELLGVSLKTVRNWRTKREGPRVSKLGRRTVRYQPVDVQAFIDGQGGTP